MMMMMMMMMIDSLTADYSIDYYYQLWHQPILSLLSHWESMNNITMQRQQCHWPAHDANAIM